MSNQSEWNARYYAENRIRISKQRRRKYVRDRKYRERARVRAREYRRMHPIRVRSGVRREWVMPILINKRPGYLMGDLVRMTGLSKNRIRKWEKSGVLPRPMLLSDDGGWRIYTQSQVDLIAEAVKECGIEPTVPRLHPQERTEILQQFKKIVHERWTTALSKARISKARRAKNGRRTRAAGGQ